jgi:hypothetical protein
MIMFGSFLPSLLVGFSTTNSTRAWEPTLSWNQLRSLTRFTHRGCTNKERPQMVPFSQKKSNAEESSQRLALACAKNIPRQNRSKKLSP